MTSELRVDNLKGSTTGGSISVLGEGTSATTNLQQGLVKVWLQYNSDGNAIYNSFNVSGVSDLATGNFQCAFSNSMNDDDYALSGAAGFGYSMCFEDNEGEKTTATGAGLIEVSMSDDVDNSSVDQTVCSLMIAGDLA
jgi:hypothetical protein